jgi:hypothetical protein
MRPIDQLLQALGQLREREWELDQAHRNSARDQEAILLAQLFEVRDRIEQLQKQIVERSRRQQ